MEVGPPHSVHQAIRQTGGGRFSHWGYELYFSASDNSNPNSNGKRYRVALPDLSEGGKSLRGAISQIAYDEDLLFSAVRQNVNKNDRAFYNILHCYRNINRLLGMVGESAEGKTVLEIGTSREPGLPLTLLFTGTARYYANNIFPIDDWVSDGYARLIYLILSGLLPRDPVPWPEICDSRTGSDGKLIARLRPEKFVSLSPLPAEGLSLPDNSVDLIFSFSVLEHVKKPQEVIRNMFRMLRPGGVIVHGIDLRDHSNFSKPIDFLTYSPEDYVLQANATENRWRASDFLDCFTGEGFECLKELFRDTPPALTAGETTDVCEDIMEPFGSTFKGSFAAVTPWVTDEMRAKFHPAYRGKSLADLSVLTMALIMRKP
jgi:SAM-dependent methyltransferase